MPRILRPLDRYVLKEFFRIFSVSALGFPLLVIVFDLTDHLEEFLARGLTKGTIALSYVYWLPESVFFVLPASVLFATVFTIGAMTRHSEIAAAKASGISFHRLIFPLLFGAIFASGLDLALGEYVPTANRHRSELLKERNYQPGRDRYNFTYVGDGDRIYTVGALYVDSGMASRVQIVRKGTGAAYPTYIFSSDSGRFDPASLQWHFGKGTIHVIPDSTNELVLQFASATDHRLSEQPKELAVSEKAPDEMNYRELGRVIAAMQRSGAKVGKLRVERMLKLSIPMTCIIILLFGAPLATSSERGGATFGIGISLASTVLFLMLNQLMKAVGGNGLVSPELAAWVPSIVFGLVGLVLLLRVRT